MTDRELLKLAAEAAGIETEVIAGGFELRTNIHGHIWDPLDDDGDALRLAVKLGISITPYPYRSGPKHSVLVKQYRTGDVMRESNPTEVVELYGLDPDAATRRAIVRAAAAITLERRFYSSPTDKAEDES